ncbi:hypothetical protein E3N88_31523 [Mikania micrantha]|uniref:RNase H type-1 domain-containing protein n=1 Tax=Mikania micrantha TaxID=192012 RepID=A0A5N6MQJ1_9ASTR|nr:hypothetical protein E3N88_31523 [Mikania micrantha]
MIPSLPLDLSHSLGHYNTGVMMASQGYRTEVMAGSVNPLTEPFPFIFPPSGQMAVSAVGLNQTTAPPTNGGVTWPNIGTSTLNYPPWQNMYGGPLLQPNTNPWNLLSGSNNPTNNQYFNTIQPIHPFPPFNPISQPFAIPTYHTEPFIQTTNPENTAHIAEMIDELSRPYVPTTHTKFSPRIANFPFPPKTKMPANVKTYDGLGDPDDHLELFTGAAMVERWSLPLWCHIKFLANFMQQKRYTRDPVELHNIKQKDEEDLRAFMERYKTESLSIGGATEQMRVSGYIHGVRPRQLIEDLNRKIPKTMEEAMERTEAFVRGKEAAQALDMGKRPKGQVWKKSPPRQQNKYPRYTSLAEKRPSHRSHDTYRPYGRSGSGYEEDRSRNVQFTALTKSPKEILATEEARFNFRPPKPMPKNTERQSNKFCDFHGDVGHHTNDCFQLKKRIEAAVKSGELAHLVKDIKEKKDTPNRQQNDKEKKNKEILMVSVGESPDDRKRRDQEEWMARKIKFPAIRPERKSSVPMVINMTVGNAKIHRVYLDGGSASEIMYEHCFNQLDEDIRRTLKTSYTPLIGFAGEKVHPLGEITLGVTMGTEKFNRTEELTFLVIRAPSRYNVIIGRPGISAFGAIVSTAHEMVKFPTKTGICTIYNGKETYLTEAADVTKLSINPLFPDQLINIGPTLDTSRRSQLMRLLRNNVDVFAWTPSDMTGVPRKKAEHKLEIREGSKPVTQKKRGMAIERSEAIKTEVTKLVTAGILREVPYHTWIANPVMVRKQDGTWRMCVDFKDLNKACPKDCYPLPEIDAKVDAIAGFKFKCFLDAYKGYHQVQMRLCDEEKTAFYTPKGIFCYTKMPFGLKNAGATYQRLVDSAFQCQVGRNMEAYVDDLVIKSNSEEEMMHDIEETFGNLRKINMKLNPSKCSFGFEEGKFLGHVVSRQDIKANPEKLRAVQQLRSPKNKKEVQSLNGKLGALHRFLSKLAERSLPFFQTLKSCGTTFQWSDEAEKAFQDMKQYIADIPSLVAPVMSEHMFLYVAVGGEAISSVLVVERSGTQLPVYFLSRVLREAETRYPEIEKAVLAIVHTARRLRRYFQAHHINVLTNLPIREALQKPESSGRLAKWAIELGEHGLTYLPRTAIKGQVLADFIMEGTTPKPPEGQVLSISSGTKEEGWVLYTDGASNMEGSGAGLILIDPAGVELTYALRLAFPSTNNEAEYEALIAGLQLAVKMKVQVLQANVDSLLVANQVNGSYETKGDKMKKYLAKTKSVLQLIPKWQVNQIARSQNKKADALSKLASVVFAHLTKTVLVEVVTERAIQHEEVQSVVLEEESWMTPIKDYLSTGMLPDNKDEATRLKLKAAHKLSI